MTGGGRCISGRAPPDSRRQGSSIDDPLDIPGRANGYLKRLQRLSAGRIERRDTTGWTHGVERLIIRAQGDAGEGLLPQGLAKCGVSAEQVSRFDRPDTMQPGKVERGLVGRENRAVAQHT